MEKRFRLPLHKILLNMKKVQKSASENLSDDAYLKRSLFRRRGRKKFVRGIKKRKKPEGEKKRMISSVLKILRKSPFKI